MKSQVQPSRATRSRPGLRRLLSVCEYFLRNGDYASCRDYAVKAQICNPNHPGPCQILAISSILAASSSTARPDFYSILHLPQFAQDPNAIENNFYLLSNLVNPSKNPYPLAAKAHEWVMNAWMVLSEPSRKAEFDKELKMSEGSERNGATFWTMCPYCCYMYEYKKVYEECCLRCQNVKCRSAYTAVPIPASAAPPEPVKNGVYFCYGFSPLGRGTERDGGSEAWKWWAPFACLGSRPGENKANVTGDHGLRNEKGDSFIEISDDETENKDGAETEANDGAETEANDGEISGNATGDEAKEVGVEELDNGRKVAMKRKKMMARTSKKVMGRGIRVNWKESFPEEADEGEDLGVENGGDSKDFGCGGTTNRENGVSHMGGLKFQEGDDDIFVSLETNFDVGNGEIGAS